MSDEYVPAGVKVISVLYYIGAVFAVIFGLLFLFGAGMISSFISQIPLLVAPGTSVFIVTGIIMIAIGVLSFFVGRDLWKARKWARIVAIIFAALGVLIGVISMIQGNITSNIVGLVINLVIGGYLLISSNVKQAFA